MSHLIQTVTSSCDNSHHTVWETRMSSREKMKQYAQHAMVIEWTRSENMCTKTNVMFHRTPMSESTPRWQPLCFFERFGARLFGTSMPITDSAWRHTQLSLMVLHQGHSRTDNMHSSICSYKLRPCGSTKWTPHATGAFMLLEGASTHVDCLVNSHFQQVHVCLGCTTKLAWTTLCVSLTYHSYSSTQAIWTTAASAQCGNEGSLRRTWTVNHNTDV